MVSFFLNCMLAYLCLACWPEGPLLKLQLEAVQSGCQQKNVEQMHVDQPWLQARLKDNSEIRTLIRTLDWVIYLYICYSLLEIRTPHYIIRTVYLASVLERLHCRHYVSICLAHAWTGIATDVRSILAYVRHHARARVWIYWQILTTPLDAHRSYGV